jgi:aryl-alcohol dehydrogenase-like predicted oxidoreductase
MEKPPEGTRVEEASQKGWSESWETYANERTWSVLDAIFEIAKETGKQPAQVALRWLMQKPYVTAPIVGARTFKHLETNLGAAGWKMSVEQMNRLDQVSAVKPGYPGWFLQSNIRRK